MGAPERAPVVFTSRSAAPRWVALTAAISLAAVVVYLGVVAARLQVDHLDAFRVLLGGRGAGARAPLLSLIAAGLPGLRAAHLASVAVFALLLVVFHRLLRLHLPPTLAWVGTVALGLQGQLVHAAPMFREDVLATMLATAGLFFYLRPRAWNLVVAGVLLGLAGAARIELLPLLLVVVVAHELIGLGDEPRRPPVVLLRLAALLLVPAAVLLLAHGLRPGAPLHELREIFRLHHARGSAIIA
ncbi:MAG TPA: hypothetical protein VN914_21540, partial [Polyangia bacterium]|nr:hypothetical protein [Polyangia bacterium]